MHKRFCLLGVEDSPYTKAMAYEFKRKRIPYSIILVKKNKNKNIKLFSNIFNPLAKLIKILNSTRFISLPKFHWFTWLIFTKYIIHFLTKNHKKLYFESRNLKLNGFLVNSINDNEVLEYLKKKVF